MEYFIIKNNIQQGPFSVGELRLHDITSDTLVWAEGMAQWVPAWNVEELKPLFYGDRPKTGTPAPPPVPAGPASGLQAEIPTADAMRQPDNQEVPKTGTTGRSHKKRPWLIIILASFLVFMGVTNPSENQHRAAVKENAAQGVVKSFAKDNDILSQGMSAIGYMIAVPLIDNILDYMLEYHNYLLFSTTSITTKKGDTVISYGFLGNVFTADAESVARAIRSTINNPNKDKNSFDNDDHPDGDSGNDGRNNAEARSGGCKQNVPQLLSM